MPGKASAVDFSPSVLIYWTETKSPHHRTCLLLDDERHAKDGSHTTRSATRINETRLKSAASGPGSPEGLRPAQALQ